MSKSKTVVFPVARISYFLFAVIVFLTTGCVKDQYEIEIERFYYENINGSVNISKIKLDTAVTYEQARPWLEKKLERVKARLRNTYSEQYEKAVAAKADPVRVAALKAKLDSANAGLFSPNNHEIKVFSSFLTDKPNFEQITLHYKVWEHGTIMQQVFIRTITPNDTTLKVTEKGISEYLKY